LEQGNRNALSGHTHLSLRGIRKSYNGREVVRGIDLDVPRGELLCLLGPSGCGKTTTLNIIAGFIELDEGTISVDGNAVHDVPPYRRNMGMVFQNYALFPHLTAFENVAFGLRLRKLARSEIQARVERAIELTNLRGHEHHYPRQLSGGQQQRVALARALVIEPSVLLLDEPFSNLDAKLRRRMRDEVRAIQRAVGITTIFVTHDQEEALAISDRIAVLRDGQLEDLGTPEQIYRRPRSVAVASFIGDLNVIGETFVRPEALRLRRPLANDSASAGRIEGTIEEITFLGARRRYRVKTESLEADVVVEVSESGEESYRFGERVVVEWDSSDATTFRA